MLRSTVSRIRLSLTALGCAVLGASLFDWAQTLPAAADRYAWVDLDSSSAPAIETAEVWYASAGCARPFFVKAILRSKAELASYYKLAPEAVRASRNRELHSYNLHLPPDQRDLYHLVNDEQDGQRRSAAEMEYDATLHAQYAEWYAAVSKLTIQQNQWEQRLINLADQKILLSEATRKNFRADSSRDFERVNAKGDFEHYVLFLLGLGGFSGAEEQAIRLDCVSITPVKRIFKGGASFKEVWRWPLDHVAAFSLGLELVFVGMLFVPIALWVSTGDLQLAKRHIGDVANRLVKMVRNFRGIKILVQLRSTIAAMLARTRASLTALMDSGRASLLLRIRPLAKGGFACDRQLRPMRTASKIASGQEGEAFTLNTVFSELLRRRT